MAKTKQEKLDLKAEKLYYKTHKNLSLLYLLNTKYGGNRIFPVVAVVLL